jgi:hypothetical protein
VINITFNRPAPSTRAEKKMYAYLQENPGYYCAPYPGGRQYTMLARMEAAGLVVSAPVPFYGENWYAVVDGMPVPREKASTYWRVPKPWGDWMEQESIPLPAPREY